MPFIKKPPVKLNLQEYRLIDQIISDIDENDLTSEEFELRSKVRKIASNIEKAIKYQREKGTNQNGRQS